MLPMNRPQPPSSYYTTSENAALQQAQAALSQFNADRDYGLSVAGLTGFLNGTPTLNWRNYQLNVSSAAANAQTRAYEQALSAGKPADTFVRVTRLSSVCPPERRPPMSATRTQRSRCSDGRTATAADFFKPRLSEKMNHLCAQGTEVIYDKEMKM